ncbi:hypothetical protein BCV39_08655 [Vibrio sp. 10N.286.55.E10]|uniref:hypothetical protein n=1 Tax=unclassified Vibrio TaxID=2614977 RepID=UPI000C85E908|nr:MULTISPECIES: hypothetical protein [unclassified Vibrio]PME29182.1 hypothetical protein BCV39_08655 [Vibrio sp. 10N.286.55.E10]PME38757.1 hypothetical protein BCV40_00900 [Vibrio sp. 10N.286.55.E12]PME61152.1 hypothetical protein BCV32_05755 [Vibrio sp. 10N.286.55.C11]
MLKAILHGKAGRIEYNKDESVSWSSLFKAREDLLTSTFFERFAYLSDDVQTQILASCFSLSPDDFQAKFGAFQSIDYWPRYELSEGGESRQVEPDLVIRFELCNLIVEVKPPEGGDQYYEQWQREVASFIQSDEHNELPLHFLAIGRIEASNATQWAELLHERYDCLKTVSATKWQAVTDNLVKLIEGDGISPTDRRVLTDMLEALALYGLKTNSFEWHDLICHGFNALSLQHSLLSEHSIKQELVSACVFQSEPRLINHNFTPVSLDTLSVWPRNSHE